MTLSQEDKYLEDSSDPDASDPNALKKTVQKVAPEKMDVVEPVPGTSTSAISVASTNKVQAMKNLRAAKGIMKRVTEAASKGETLTPEQITKRKWAEEVLSEREAFLANKIKENATKTGVLASKEVVKRVRSSDEILSSKDSKKVRNDIGKTVIQTLDRLPISDLLKRDLEVSIVDTNQPDWKISVENFTLIDNFLIKEIFKGIQGKTLAKVPVYDMDKRFHGYRIITCDTPFAVDFLRQTISKMDDTWPNAKVEVKLLRELPTQPKAFISVPTSNISREELMTLLAAYNPDIPVNTWKLVRLSKVKFGRVLASLIINDDSVRILEEKKCLMRFTIRKLPVRVCRFESLEAELELSTAGNEAETDAAIADLLDKASIIDAVEASKP